MHKLIKSLQWLDKNILKVLLVIYIFLIPLYPKLPIQNVNYTYVAIRVDDFFVGLFAVVFVVQLLRKKVTLWTKFMVPFILFWLAVLASYIWGYFFQQTIPDIHVGLLHFGRRIEYMMIFFMVASIVESKKEFYFYLKTIFITFTLVVIYGIGQKFLGWPAVQTMNAEYARGYILFLDAYARVSSTFGGHYDLAAYLVLLMPLVFGMFLSKKNYLYLIIFIGGVVVIILTASRVSYGAYILAMIMFLVYTRKFKWLAIVLVITFGLTPLSDNLTKRISRTFSYQKIYVDPNTSKVIVPKDMRPDDLPPGDFVIGKVDTSGQAGTNTDTGVEANRAKEQIRKSIVNQARQSGAKLSDEEIAAQVESTFKGLIPQNQLLPDISQSTRFQVEWPRAIAAFLRNPLLGKGPSSITEATDNDYLRWFGELGLLGALTFIYILWAIFKYIWDLAKKVPADEKYIYLGFLAGFIGLLINATYIDVFEASKVAYVFWLLTGLFAATHHFHTPEAKATHRSLFNLKIK